jgi:hypothetical protein
MAVALELLTRPPAAQAPDTLPELDPDTIEFVGETDPAHDVLMLSEQRPALLEAGQTTLTAAGPGLKCQAPAR